MNHEPNAGYPGKGSEAVSLVEAEQTGLWHVAPNGTELERTSSPSGPVYNAGEIRTWHDGLVACYRDSEIATPQAA
jgi:LPS sulfotransferase NodH